MARYQDDAYEEEDPQSRRESLMERRLRKARGEEIDDNLDSYEADDDDAYTPRTLNRPGPFRGASVGGGCAAATLYIVLGGLVALLIMFFFFNRTLSGIGSFFGGLSPDLSALSITPTPAIRSGTAVIQRIQQLNRLETTSYTVERVIDVEQSTGWGPVVDFFGNDRLLLIAHGTVEAGLDLSKLGPQDVSISADGSRLTVRLPPVEIFSRTLDNSKTRVYERDRGVFAPDNPNLETQARQRAEEELLVAACEGGIMQRATEDGRQAMEQFLSLLDFAQVEVVPAAVPACALPASTIPVP